MIKIKKSNNNEQLFDITKIKKYINNIFQDLNVSPNILLNDFEQIVFTKKQLNSQEIYDLLINTAINKTELKMEDDGSFNFNNLDWIKVASRLKIKQLYKKIATVRNIDKNSPYSNSEEFFNYINEMVKENFYDSSILHYTSEEIKEIYSLIAPERDFKFDFAGVNLLIQRYLFKNKNELTCELPQEMFLILSILLATPSFSYKPFSFEEKKKLIREIYDAISSFKISLATPILMNLRRKDGNLASCFLGQVDDSLNGIMHSNNELAQISKNGGGVGLNISNIRANQSWVKGLKGKSNGIMPWVKIFNDTAVAVNQLGSRAGSATVALDIWHLDIEEFLDCQKFTGDLRKKAYDIFPQIVIQDLFMKRVENNENWTLFDPYEIKQKFNINLVDLWGKEFDKQYQELEKSKLIELKKVVNAKTLFKEILKNVVETGLPYIFFKDTVNKNNINKNSGMIYSSNLCVESFSNFNKGFFEEDCIREGLMHTCNLCSLNHAEILNKEDLKHCVELSVLILNNTTNLTKEPTKSSALHNAFYRILGIGSMGYADHLAYKKIPYSKAQDYTKNLAKEIYTIALRKSSLLAKERGSYICFNTEHFIKKLPMDIQLDIDLMECIRRNGMRNGGLIAIAPNTSTSVLLGCSSSILPVFSKFFIDKNSKGSVPVIAKYLNKDTFLYYQENKNMDQNNVIDIVSCFQQYTDQGISMELYIDVNKITAVDLYNYYINAWKKGCKTVYYVRQITKQKEESCISCAN